MQFTDVLKTRVSTRSFDSRPVPDGAVKSIVDAALYAPVGMHRYETLHLTVIKNPYILDYLTRKQGLTLKECSQVIAAPFWSTISIKDEEERNRLSYMRKMFSSFLITGPFSILVGFRGGMMALNDRLKLRSLVAAEKGNTVYFSSEEAAIRVVEENPDRIWAPRGGEAMIVTLDEEAER